MFTNGFLCVWFWNRHMVDQTIWKPVEIVWFSKGELGNLNIDMFCVGSVRLFSVVLVCTSYIKTGSLGLNIGLAIFSNNLVPTNVTSQRDYKLVPIPYIVLILGCQQKTSLQMQVFGYFGHHFVIWNQTFCLVFRCHWKTHSIYFLLFVELV